MKKRKLTDSERTIITAVSAGILSGILSLIIIGIRDGVSDNESASEFNNVYASTIPQEQVDMTRMNVPDGDTSFKAYMDWECITNTNSKQYDMQQRSYTDSIGLRRYKNGDYMIAMGSYYGSVGDRFKITLDSGKTFECVLGDMKADRHTDALNQYTAMEDDLKNVVEFIVDTDVLSDTVRQMGDVSYAGFEGNIQKIERFDE